MAAFNDTTTIKSENEIVTVSLVEQFSSDESVFDTIYDMLSPEILKYILSQIQDDSVADDILQEVFVRAYIALKGGKFKEYFTKQDGKSSLVNYIYTIALHEVKRYYGKTSNNRFESLDHVDSLHIVSNDDPTDMIEIKEIHDIIVDLILELPGIKRIILYLKSVNDYNFDEISEMTGQTKDSVRKNFERGRTILLNKIQRRYPSILRDYGK